MKWMISEDRLGSDQRDVIDEIGKITSKPIWIQGYAGSGKSVLLLHLLKDYLVRKPNAKVCVAVFTRALVDLIQTGLRQTPYLQDKVIPVLTIYGLKKEIDNLAKYDAIFCDEIQDIPREFITKMRQSCTHFIIAGDAAQSIYPTVPVFETPPATSEEIKLDIQPIEKNLKVIYRLTRSVISMLKCVFTDLLGERPIIGAVDTEVKLFKAISSKDEVAYCWKDAKETNQLRTSDVIAILIWGRDEIVEFANVILAIEGKQLWPKSFKGMGDDGSPEINFHSLNMHLEINNIPLMYIGNGVGSLERADRETKIIVMTYHSAKGLDFDHVYLPMTGNEMKINSNVPVNALILVALSRSKSGLTITFSGEIYDPLKPFLQNLTIKSLPKPNTEIMF